MTETTHEALVRQTGAAEELLDYFQGNRASMDAKIAAKEAQVDTFLANAANHHPLVRTSPNQNCIIDGATNNLQGWSKNGAFSITVSLLRTISSGQVITDLSADDQELMNAMGYTGGQSNWLPNPINVAKMVWSGSPGSGHTIWPPSIPAGGPYTVASYAKLISGSISAGFLSGVNSEWGMCGGSGVAQNLSYQNMHPNVGSASGEVHFVLPACCYGYRVIDRDNPRWGFITSTFATAHSDFTT